MEGQESKHSAVSFQEVGDVTVQASKDVQETVSQRQSEEVQTAVVEEVKMCR
jgi:hypothetical protein